LYVPTTVDPITFTEDVNGDAEAERIVAADVALQITI
jgi:hypothetical protein